MMAGWHYMVSLIGIYAQLSGIVSQNCTTGSGVLNGQCLTVCNPGTYINATNNICVQCELGFYQDQNNATSCKLCGTGRITLIRGSPSYLYCVVPCSAGRYHTDTINTAACAECPVGQYQSASGQQSCLTCPLGRTSYLTGSTLCYDICNAGSFFNTTLVSCQYCPPGLYQPNTGRAECFICPPGYVSTTGSTQCQVFCSAGQRIDNRTSQCVPCEIGTYQPETSQTSCISCGIPENWVTNRTGSTSISDCSFFCPSGYYKVGINSCESCPIGTYKDSAIDRFGSCQQCPPDSTTNGTRTTSIAFCNIYLCSPGTFWNLNQTRCQPCQRGTYQPNSGLTSCILCESSKTTNTTGAVSANQCIFICQRGFSHNSSTDRCDPCPVGFYQDVADQMFCKTCGFAFTTLSQASTSLNDCIEICRSGTQYISIGQCEPCQRGTYRTAGIGTIVCQNCPNGFTTIGTGTPLISDCNIAACYPGTYRTINNICEACPLGTYQPEYYQESCSLCGPATNWFTEQVGSVIKDQCKFFCPSGYEVASNNTCDICPIGYYKDNTINVFNPCVQCPNNTFTGSRGSTSVNNCSIAECPVGYQRNNTLSGCQPCGVGFYQPSVNQNVCISCPPNYSTRSPASDSSSDCELYCPSGQVLQNNTCISCQRGYYKDNTISPFMMCTRCPPNYVTPSIGSTSITYCYVRDCPAGTRRNQNDTGCIDCELGFYQPTPYNTSCIQCQSGYSTNTTRSTSITQCNRYCPPGTELINNTSQCNPCPIGFYSEIGFNTVCNKCMDGFITENTGSTSVLDCNIVACEAGSYRDVTTNTCQLCPIGEYQDSKYQSSCKQCGDASLHFIWQTNHTGSTSLSECIYHCSSGYELRQDGYCYICPVGQYKDNKMNILSVCTVCPDGKVTPGEGAISQSQCTIRDCPAGYFASLIVDRCIPCGFGAYQPRRNQTSCMNCPTGTSTKQTGSTSFSECFLYCQSGYEIVPNNASACQECQRGYYKDNNMGIYSFCTRCPANFTTNRTAAVSSAECNIPVCSTGFFLNIQGNCQACSIGTYQPSTGQTSCISCQTGTITLQTGSSSSTQCVGEDTRVCNANGTWGEANYDQCVSNTLIRLISEIEKLKDGILVTNVSAILETAKTATVNELGPMELEIVVSLLNHITDIKGNVTNFNDSYNATKNFVETASNIVDENKITSWQTLKSKKGRGAEIVLNTIDNFFKGNSVCSFQINESRIQTKNIDVKIGCQLPADLQTSRNNESLKGLNDALYFPIQEDNNYTYTAVLYNNLSGMLQNKILMDGNIKNGSFDVGPVVMSLQLDPQPKLNKLAMPLELMFQFFDSQYTNPICSYWMFNATGYGEGAWLSDGCSIKVKNASGFVCECSHLTNFAILMTLSEVLDPAHDTRLSIISVVGCAISLTSLLLTIIGHVQVWKYVRSKRTNILLNICVALLISYVIFLAGVDRTDSKIACTVIAACLHYFYLAVFFIMLVEGIEIAVSTIYVFQTRSRRKWLLPLAWIIPAGIVGVSLGISRLHGYGNDKFCWLSVQHGLIWAFVGPVALIIAINVVIIVIVIRKMFTLSAFIQKERKEKIKTSLRSLGVLLPITGVTWVFGILSVNEDTVVFQYLFTIFNSLQGLFIFIFHCLLNKQIHDAMKLRNRRRKMSDMSASTLRTASRDEQNWCQEELEFPSLQGPTGRL